MGNNRQHQDYKIFLNEDLTAVRVKINFEARQRKHANRSRTAGHVTIKWSLRTYTTKSLRSDPLRILLDYNFESNF